MPATRTFDVTLIPAKCDDVSVSYMLFDPKSKEYKIEASTLDSLGVQLRKLVQDDFKMDCAACVFVPRGERKPNGFDKWKLKHCRFFKYEEGQEAAAA